jgi:hypothetical protein
MGWDIVRRTRDRTAETVLAGAWRVEIEAMRARKSSPGSGSVPCHHCDAESPWHLNRCGTCGADYDEHELRFRARMYEALAMGD